VRGQDEVAHPNCRVEAAKRLGDGIDSLKQLGSINPPFINSSLSLRIFGFY